MSRTNILNHENIANKIKRIAYQICEVNSKETEIILAGIDKKGYVLAEKIAKELKKISTLKIDLCKVKINKKEPLAPVLTSLDAKDYTNKSIVVVDDVLHTGTTLIYAVKHFLSVPLQQLNTAVLVDRNHKKYPVKVDFKGISLSTSLQDTVKVIFSNKKDSVYLS